jgi:hypothetical protein
LVCRSTFWFLLLSFGIVLVLILAGNWKLSNLSMLGRSSLIWSKWQLVLVISLLFTTWWTKSLRSSPWDLKSLKLEEYWSLSISLTFEEN